jgi:hypothetical protein
VYQCPDHPDITTALATGYHKPYKPLLCGVCGEVIQIGEYYGEFSGKSVCSDCLEDEWQELTVQEKADKLGYNAKFNG